MASPVDNSIKVITKIYPTKYKNKNNNHIGNFSVSVDANQMPFSSVDQVNHFLVNLFDYVKNESENDLTKKKKITEFFVNYKKTQKFEPIDYPLVTTTGGTRRKQTRKRTSRRKRKTLRKK
jgi:hypothetical protein